MLATNPDVVLAIWSCRKWTVSVRNEPSTRNVRTAASSSCRVSRRKAPTVKSHVCSILDKFGLQGRNLRLGLVRRKAFLCECHSAMLSCSIVSEAIKAARWAEATPDNPVISRPSVAGFGP